jgi:Trypsin-like peptidase domain/Effector-associated domain 1
MNRGRTGASAQLAALRRILADLFPRETDQRRFVADAGLRAATIGFEASAENTWFNILQRAQQTVGIEAVLRLALASDEGQGNPDLLRFEAGIDLAPLPAPDIKMVQWQGPMGAARTLEKIIGSVSTLVPVSFLALGLERARSVALVKLPDSTSGSGFLIKLPFVASSPTSSVVDDLFVTNHHVLPDANAARAATLLFDYERATSGLTRAPTEVSLAPERFFATSEIDDWTIVATQPGTAACWGAIPLLPVEDLRAGARVNIIQHPGGGEKKLSYLANEVVYVGGDRVQYLTDTEPGSSGSPVFDLQWRLVALHHSGGYMPEPGTSSERTFLRNEGITIDAIVRGLTAAQGG